MCPAGFALHSPKEIHLQKSKPEQHFNHQDTLGQPLLVAQLVPQLKLSLSAAPVSRAWILTWLLGAHSTLSLSPSLSPARWHQQEVCPDYWDLRGPTEKEQIHRVPAGKCAEAEGVPLQTHPVPEEASHAQEGRQLCEYLSAGSVCCSGRFGVRHSS